MCPYKKKYSSLFVSAELFHISAGMPSGPVVLTFFIFLTVLTNSSYVSGSACGSVYSSGSYSYPVSSSVDENLSLGNCCHNLSRSSSDWMSSSVFLRVGCVDLEFLVLSDRSRTPW